MADARRLWPQMLWQGAAICALAAAVGFGVNALRPDRLPLVGDWSVKGQLAAQSEQGEQMPISLEEASALYFSQKAVFLDARPKEFFEMGHIDGARNLPWEEFEARFSEVLADLPPETTLITYCDGEDCSLSKELATALLGKGFTHVQVLLNGWTRWQEANLPAIQNGEEP